jgi:hypothetical protein
MGSGGLPRFAYFYIDLYQIMVLISTLLPSSILLLKDLKPDYLKDCAGKTASLPVGVSAGWTRTGVRTFGSDQERRTNVRTIVWLSSGSHS